MNAASTSIELLMRSSREIRRVPVGFAIAATLLTLVAHGEAQPSGNTYSPACLRSGIVPAAPPLVVSGGEVILEVTVADDGHVAAVVAPRTTPPFTDVVTRAVREWRFTPARVSTDRQTGPIESKVLVAAVFRRPSLMAPTLEGVPPRTVASPSPGVPFPIAMAEPPFPPAAYGGGVLLVEALIERDGAIGAAVILRSVPPFDEVVRAALRGWKFRPARLGDEPVPSYAYLLFGFPAPVG